MRFPEGTEYVRITREREQVSRKAAEGTRVKLAISLVSCDVRTLEGRGAIPREFVRVLGGMGSG